MTARTGARDDRCGRGDLTIGDGPDENLATFRRPIERIGNGGPQGGSMKRRIAYLVVLAGAFALPAAAQQITFMTGPQGGSWIPLGGALKNLWEQAVPGLSIQQTPGAGIANVRGVDEGKAQVGFANSATTVDGLEGRPPYPKKVTKVCQVANLYPQYFQVVALKDAHVKSFADWKGKSLVTQPKGNTSEILTEEVLKINGMSYQSLGKTNFQASYTDAVSMMKDGHADVFTLGTTSPASAVMDLASARDIDLVPVDDRTMSELRKLNPGYHKLTIKAGTYPKQDKDVPAIGYTTHIVAACDLPEDAVYRMTKAMAAHIADMAAIVKPIEGLTAKDMAADIGVPLHKGAARYYKEVGAI
jgi:TRAP transporter TAXI family solute receptor